MLKDALEVSDSSIVEILAKKVASKLPTLLLLVFSFEINRLTNKTTDLFNYKLLLLTISLKVICCVFQWIINCFKSSKAQI